MHPLVPLHPFRVNDTAGAIQRTLRMPREERRKRQSMRDHVMSHDADFRSEHFLVAPSAAS